nr:unnamed protein product [Digitaria exilis]
MYAYVMFGSHLLFLNLKEDKTNYFLKLRRWWKGVDLFEKAYILLPVHAETHWSLVIVCMPTKDDQTGPIILHLDSLKFHNSRLIFSVVCRFLKEEWNYLNENGSSAECPLHETVWKNLPRKIEKKPVEFGKRWFRPEEPSQLRCEIRRLLQKCREAEPCATELFGEPEPKNGVTEPTTSEHLPEVVDAATAKEITLIDVEETCRSA